MKLARILGSSSFATVALMSASFAAEAPKSQFSHTFFGNSGGNYTMVSCDYAENLVEKVMTEFGAKNIDVNCSGGIQPYGISPITIDTTYDAPALTGQTVVTKLVLESDWGSNCTYDTSVTKALLSAFPNVKAARKSDGCFDPTTRYDYEFEVTQIL